MARADGGVDSAFSLDQRRCTDLFLRLSVPGSPSVTCTMAPPGPNKSVVFRRSIYVVADIELGENFTESNIRILRPGLGAPPSFYPKLLGCSAKRAFRRGETLSFDDVL